MAAMPCCRLLYLLLTLCTVTASLGTAPAHSVDLPNPISGKEAASPSSAEARTRTVRALTLLDCPRYPDDFHHFSYVNPDAPKQGTFRTAEVGAFYNLVPFTIQQSNLQIWLVYEQLFTSPRDDPLSSYPLIAESAEIAEDGAFVIFHLNPKARWHDGAVITSEDVIFTFDILRKHDRAIPYFRIAYKDVKSVQAIGPHQVKFTLSPERNDNLPFFIASMHILPKHYFTKSGFGKASLEPPLGSGPYRVGQVLPSRRIVYERVEDYWARDLPTRRGLYNFDRWVVDYYRDTNAKVQAFMAGLSDMIVEFNPMRWRTYSTLPEKPRHPLIMVESQLQGALGNMNFAFNLRRPPFDDLRVREAITQLFDFEWINRVLLGGWAQRNYSQFPNSELAAQGRPSAAELDLLLPWKGEIRDEIFEEAFIPPISDGSGYQREQRRRAFELFAEAGYTVQDGKLVNGAGEQLSIEILTGNADFQNVVLAFVHSLRRVGIDARLRIVDSSQFERRIRGDFDFDMTFQFFSSTNIPGPEQELFWGSKFAYERYTLNVPGVEDPSVDALIGRIGQATSRRALIPATRAFDRLMMWNGYLVPGWYMGRVHYAYWDRFGRADLPVGQESDRAMGFSATEAWWVK